jgi:DNA topoisomerase-2
MTDQDVDGSHIKGLLFNLFNTMWPSLIIQTGFMNSMLTPIVKAKKKNIVHEFYNLTDYENWKKQKEEKKVIGKWDIKYYKGLGTSTEKEAKEYFRNLKNVEYIWNEKDSKEKIDLAFNKKRADNRKDWLYQYDKQKILKHDQAQVEYNDFIDKDLIHFSVYDNGRSLPSFCDGLKISTRKILYSCFKRNLVKEVRVAQLAGYVSKMLLLVWLKILLVQIILIC